MEFNEETEPNNSSNILMLSEDAFFTELEKQISAKIPSLMRKMLLINHVDSAAVLSKVDENYIKKIENFLKNELISDMLSNSESMEQYLGIYAKCQKQFKLSSGQEILLRLMVAFCKNLFQSNKKCEIPSNIEVVRDVVVDSLDVHEEEFSNDESFEEPTTQDGYSGLFDHIGSLMLTIYNDAKRTTLSAWSWPSRIVAAEMARKFKFGLTSTSDFDLEYVTPSSHAELLSCIVESDIENFKNSLIESLAVSLRLDGSVDRTQKHNVFVMVQIVKKDASIGTLGIGFDVPKASGASGYLQCLKNITNKVLPWEEFFQLITSIVTDGESLNLGRINGLVAKLQELRNLSQSNLPLISIWCIPHRTNLAWKSVSTINIIAKLITRATKLSKHFHASGKRTEKLNNAAAENGLPMPLRYPSFFAVRWIEFVFNLFNVMLRNWRASIKYFESENLTAQLNQWLQYDTLHFLTFLTDILGLLKRFQKFCQSNTITLIDVTRLKDRLIMRLENCKVARIEGGWEELLLQTVVTNGSNVFLCGIKLNKTSTTRTRRMPHSFTLTTRIHIIHKLIQHLNIRMNLDTALLKAFEPFVKISSVTTQQDLILSHTAIAADLAQNEFVVQYYIADELLNGSDCDNPLDYLRKLNEISPNELRTIKIVLARIAVAKPHSADVERLISVYNKFKDTDRASLSQETLSNYLYINVNMGPLEKFDPTPAIQCWMEKKKRKPKSNVRARQQEWFNGIFHEPKQIQKAKQINPIIKF